MEMFFKLLVFEDASAVLLVDPMFSVLVNKAAPHT